MSRTTPRAPRWSYSWAVTVNEPAGSSVTLSDASAVTPAFTPAVAGSYSFELTVTDAAAATSSDTVTITVVDVAGDCLLISELIEGSSNNKAIELFNCGAGSLDLSPYTLCSINNANTTCDSGLGLSGTLAAGQTYQICNSGLDTSLLPAGVSCDINSGVTSVNGDDRLLVFVDTNGTGGFEDGADVRVDAFGQTDVEPQGIPWADRVFARCELTAYDGVGPFTLTDYFIEGTIQDDFSGFGVAPMMSGCPVVNTPPVADAGPDQAVTVNDLVTLDATGSTDVEDDATSTSLVLSWAVVNEPAGSSVTLSDASAATPTCTPAVAGDYVFELTVTDSVGDSTTDAVTISVNALPTADAGADQSVTVNATVTLDGSGSTDAEDDAAGMALDYSWALTAQPSGASVTLSDASAVAPTFTPTVDGTYVFELMVLDSDGATDADVVTITVNTDNPPVADAGADQGVAVGDMVTLDGSNSSDVEDDAAGVALTYSWAVTAEPAGSSVTLSDTSAATPTFAPAVAGSYELELTVTDSDGNTSTDTVTVSSSAVAPAQNCLIISEVLEGSSSNKAVELYNKCQAETVDLSQYNLCLISNSNTDCNTTLGLSGTLTAGQTYQICDGSLDTSLLLAGVSCDVTSGVTNFNGNDRLLLSFDDDGTPGYSTGDTRVDAFGQTDTDPGAIWADAGYSRCDSPSTMARAPLASPTTSSRIPPRTTSLALASRPPRAVRWPTTRQWRMRGRIRAWTWASRSRWMAWARRMSRTTRRGWR